MKRVALVHDWLNGMRGGEYVLEAIAELYPEAPIFTLVHEVGKVSKSIESHPIITSPLQSLPLGVSHYRHYLPLLPKLIESFDLSQFDLILSSSHCVAKGVKKAPNAKHISYVHAPMRYMWDRFDDYFNPEKASFAVRFAANLFRPSLQKWDREVSQPDHVDGLIANSKFIASEIKKVYSRESKVIYPFADLSRFERARNEKEFYLMVGAFAPYKKIDLAIEVFNELKLPLKIIGNGQEEKRLKSLAGPTIEFLGAQSNELIAELYSRARAFIFPGKEDFGITPVEAMAAGCPVIAFDDGGARETVTQQSGIFFKEQTMASLKEAILKIENKEVRLNENEIRARAAHFTKRRFQEEFRAAVTEFIS